MAYNELKDKIWNLEVEVEELQMREKTFTHHRETLLKTISEQHLQIKELQKVSDQKDLKIKELQEAKEYLESFAHLLLIQFFVCGLMILCRI